MELEFGGFQIVVLIAFLVVAVALVAIFTVVALQARRNVEFELVTETGYRLRRYWLAFLALLLTTGVVVSLFFLPYPSSADSAATVRVSGGLFYWSMSPQTVPAGSEINFDVTSADVNHGFGIYDPDGVLIGSVQAMPGYHNELDLTLDKAGTYMIACLEFCGFKHHEMIREFEVTP
ncbi:MAG: cytochrome c oxidase subunit II [Thermoleophilia bacterium]|nr:cytochrome c oxidase subunit II [Thermoleophilia bacterium]